MDIQLPISLIQNMETIILDQNKQLLIAICNWKKWDYKEMEKEFLLEKLKFNLVSPTKTNNLIESRTRNYWEYNGTEYLLETISDNVYTKDGEFVGKKHDHYLDEYAEED